MLQHAHHPTLLHCRPHAGTRSQYPNQLRFLTNGFNLESVRDEKSGERDCVRGRVLGAGCVSLPQSGAAGGLTRARRPPHHFLHRYSCDQRHGSPLPSISPALKQSPVSVSRPLSGWTCQLALQLQWCSCPPVCCLLSAEFCLAVCVTFLN